MAIRCIFHNYEHIMKYSILQGIKCDESNFVYRMLKDSLYAWSDEQYLAYRI